MAALPPGAAILDIGCGGGLTVGHLLQCGYAATGIDCDPAALEADNPALSVAQATALPCPDGSLDGIFAECTLSVCGDAPAVLAECARALRPGGYLLLSDVYFDSAAITLSKVRASLAGWKAAVEAAGFAVTHQCDRSEAWKDFYLWALWTDAYRFPCDCSGCGKAGYMLLCARRG